jgi:hypothetical protein
MATACAWESAHNSFALRLSVSSCCLTPLFMPVPLAKLGGRGTLSPHSKERVTADQNVSWL